MAKLFLAPSDINYPVVNSSTTVYGASSNQTISIGSGITGIVVDANVEGVQFSGALSTYKFKQTGNRLDVYDSAGATLISKIGLQGDSNGTQLTFSNGTFDTKYLAGSGTLNLTIGGHVVNDTTPAVLPLLSMGTTSFDFSTDQTAHFSKSGSAFSWSSGNGVVTIPSPSDEIWTLNQAAPINTSNDIYTVSAFIYNGSGNSGYAALGFSTNSSNSSTGSSASPAANSFLGVSFHGGSGNFLNDGIDGTNLNHAELSANAWYKVVFSARETSSTTFDLTLDIYNASSSSVVGSSRYHTSKVVTNSNIASAAGLYPYFANEGSRLDSIDNFEVTLITTIPFTTNVVNQSITNFILGRDKIDLSVLAIDSTLKPISGTMSPINGFVYLLATGTTGDADTVTASAAAINAAAVLADSSATSYVVITDDNSSAIYKWIDVSGSNNECVTSELTLMATVDAVLSSSDIIMAAAPTSQTFTLTSASESITGSSGDDTVNVGAFTATGTYAFGTGNDTINALTGANIAGVNSGAATTAESLVMSGTVTMTTAQYAGFTSITAVGASDYIVLTTQATGLTLNPSIETFTLGDFANSITLSGAIQVVIGGTGADSITSSAGSDTITGGAGIDVFKFLPASTNGKDTITDFVSGIGGDVLDVTAFDPTAHFNLYSWSPSNIALITIDTTAGTIDSNTASAATGSLISTPRQPYNHSITVVNMVNTAIAAKDYSSANFGDIFGTTAKAFSTTAQTIGGNDKAIILVEGTDQTQVYFAEDTHTNGTWEASDLTLVAVLTGTNNTGATWNAANFLPFLSS